ncbi:MAG: hypothetical protein JSS66_14395 [Armatimonadetes bacterium]|nr:hypothetical protein [Armatimonadota bacterium]
MAEAHAEEHHGHHVTSNRVLNTTFLQLFAAMVITILAARAPIDGPALFPGFKDFFLKWEYAWGATNAIALGIAAFKAVQVIRFFMGVQYASGLIKLYAVMGFVGFTWLYILFWDYVGRPWEPVRGWETVPGTALPRDPDSDAGVPYKLYPGKEEGASAEMSHE